MGYIVKAGSREPEPHLTNLSPKSHALSKIARGVGFVHTWLCKAEEMLLVHDNNKLIGCIIGDPTEISVQLTIFT